MVTPELAPLDYEGLATTKALPCLTLYPGPEVHMNRLHGGWGLPGELDAVAPLNMSRQCAKEGHPIHGVGNCRLRGARKTGKEHRSNKSPLPKVNGYRPKQGPPAPAEVRLPAVEAT